MREKGCIKCGSTNAKTKEVAMTGTGLSKLFDIKSTAATGTGSFSPWLPLLIFISGLLLLMPLRT
jgi:hypothetical protein